MSDPFDPQKSIDDVNKEIAVLSHLEAISKLMQGNEDLADVIAKRIEHKPLGRDLRSVLISKRKEMSYYKESFALRLKPILDEIAEKREPWAARLSDNPELGLQTLFQKVYQPWLWLKDHHPEKDKYIKLWDETKIQRKQGHGIKIVFVGHEPEQALRGSMVVEDSENLMAVQERITKFLEQDIEKDSIHIEDGLNLSLDQINTIKDSLVGAGLASMKVEARSIKLLRRYQAPS